MSGKPFAPTDYDVELGRMLATMRMRLGLSQKDVANKVGVTFQQIQKYETADNRLSVSRLHQIVTKCFGMGISDFLNEAAKPYNRNADLTDIIRKLYNTNPTGQKLIAQIATCVALAHPKSAATMV